MAKNMEVAFLLDFYGEMLTEKQREVMDLYYNQDLSLAEIAEDDGITRQGVRDSIKRAETQLMEMEERLGLAKRFTSMQEGLAVIRQAVEEIRRYNDRYVHANPIAQSVRQIEEQTDKLEES
ncbi:MAG: YlxM family DNA-binding protein [Acutalibacteraceae bacterium]